jgi:hypothetical protein
MSSAYRPIFPSAPHSPLLSNRLPFITIPLTHGNHRWNACVPDQKELIKRTALELLSGGARDHGEQAFVKNSIAKLVFEIAKREWPQNWTNLTDLLIEIGSKKVLA